MKQLYIHLEDKNISLVKRDIDYLFDKSCPSSILHSDFSYESNQLTKEYVDAFAKTDMAEELITYFSKIYVKHNLDIIPLLNFILQKKEINIHFICNLAEKYSNQYLLHDYETWKKNIRFRQSSVNNLFSSILNREDAYPFIKHFQIVEALSYKEFYRAFIFIWQFENKSLMHSISKYQPEIFIDAFLNILNSNIFTLNSHEYKDLTFIEKEFYNIYINFSKEERTNFKNKINEYPIDINNKRFNLFYDKLKLIDLYGSLQQLNLNNKNSVLVKI